MVDSLNRPAEGSNPGLEYTTRFVPTTKPGNASKILPYVRVAINTLGSGSAVAVGDKGIQLTTPTQLLHFLESTITEYDKQDIEEYIENVFYAPPVRVKGVAITLKPMIESLGICPPDMRVEWLGLGDASGLLIFSGPPSRLEHFRTAVLPNVKTLVLGLNTSPPFGSPAAG